MPLSPDQIAAYHRDGAIAGVTAVPPEVALRNRQVTLLPCASCCAWPFINHPPNPTTGTASGGAGECRPIHPKVQADPQPDACDWSW